MFIYQTDSILVKQYTLCYQAAMPGYVTKNTSNDGPNIAVQRIKIYRLRTFFLKSIKNECHRINARCVRQGRLYCPTSTISTSNALPVVCMANSQVCDSSRRPKAGLNARSYTISVPRPIYTDVQERRHTPPINIFTVNIYA